MKTKLTLEHLAPYLPYGLKFTDSVGKTFWVLMPANIASFSYMFHKPILRPLSDLSKVGADVNEHSINMLLQEKYGVEYGMFSCYKNEISIEIDGDPILRYDANKAVSFEIFNTIQKELFKNHFDVFNLIEQGLAIDINTL